MLGRLVLIAVALGAAGLLCLPMVSGRRAAGKPVVTESETVCAPEAMGGSQAYRKTVQSAFVPSTAAVSQADRETVRTTFGKLPLYFVENQGVYPGEVAFTIQGADKTLFFTPGGITMRLRGEEPQEAVFSYFKGPKKDWKTGLRTYFRVVYENLWPGIDLVYRGAVNRLKYEFLVKPGADPDLIRLRYRGVESLERTANGALAVKTPAGGFEDAPPEAWQEVEGRRVPVAMEYRLDAGDASGVAGTRDAASTREQAKTSGPASTGSDVERSFGFHVGDYDATKPLVLDPVILVYCGYIGGSGNDYGHGIAVDGAGHAYVTGYTLLSTEQTFPVTVGPDLTHNGGADVFVAKVAWKELVGSGSSAPGGQVNLSLTATGDAGLVYQLGSSFGNGPIMIDTRRLELSPDPLLFLSVSGAAPWVFQNYSGVLDAQGQAMAAIQIPNLPALKNLRIYTAFVTLTASAPSGIASISNTMMFTIQ